MTAAVATCSSAGVAAVVVAAPPKVLAVGEWHPHTTTTTRTTTTTTRTGTTRDASSLSQAQAQQRRLTTTTTAAAAMSFAMEEESIKQQQQQEASSSSCLLWTMGQQVVVQARTWAGINRPGGHGTITKLHYNDQGDVTAVDVKYTLGRSSDAHLGLHLVQPWVEPDRRDRRRATTTMSRPSQAQQPEEVASVVAAPRITTSDSTDTVQLPLEKENAPNSKAAASSGNGILRKSSLTGRRKKIADNLKKVKQHLVVVTTTTRKRGATNEAVAAAAAATKSKAPTDTPETKQKERLVDSSIPQEISFRIPAEDDDDHSVVSDLEDDGVGIEDLPPERQYILPAEERHSTIGKRWSLFVGSIAHHNGNIPAGSQTVNSGAPSRVSRPPVSVTKSLVSGHFSRTRHTTLASGAFERLPSKRKSPPSPTTSRPPLAHSKIKRKGATITTSTIGAAAAAAAAAEAADPTAPQTTTCSRRAVSATAAAVPQPPPIHTEPGRGKATAIPAFSNSNNNHHQSSPNLHITNPNNVPQKSLEQVFRKEQASATQFIQQVVSHAPASHPPAPPAARDARTTTPSPPSETTLRKQFFVALLNELLQNDDDMVEESTLLHSLNQLARKRAATFYPPPSSSSSSKCAASNAGLQHHANFDTRSMEHFLAELSLENKIMRSDGQIYSI